DLLAEQLGQLHRQQARIEIRAAARRERHDQAHRLGRIALRLGAPRRGRELAGENRRYGQAPSDAAMPRPPHDRPPLETARGLETVCAQYPSPEAAREVVMTTGDGNW